MNVHPKELRKCAREYKANIMLNGSQRPVQPLKYLQITCLPKDVFPLASKTKGNSTSGTSQSGTLKF
ncbi:hypothetical protein ANTPLA_LOCUS4139 [Anthophora plagiata]